MEFFGYEEERLVFCRDGIKGKSYVCPKCRGILRIKEGPLRRKHFFHLNHHSSCFSSNKSWIHALMQYQLFCSLPAGEGEIEKRFPSIERISDVAWTKKNLLFEIQCSPISLQEVLERNRDYQTLDMQVVWILRDGLFNRRYLSAAESFLRTRVSYFFHVDFKGKGVIYDQREVLQSFRRLRRSFPLPVAIDQPQLFSSRCMSDLPSSLQKKGEQASFFFRGDVIDCFFSQSHSWETFLYKKKKWTYAEMWRKVGALGKLLLREMVRKISHD